MGFSLKGLGNVFTDAACLPVSTTARLEARGEGLSVLVKFTSHELWDYYLSGHYSLKMPIRLSTTA